MAPLWAPLWAYERYTWTLTEKYPHIHTGTHTQTHIHKHIYTDSDKDVEPYRHRHINAERRRMHTHIETDKYTRAAANRQKTDTQRCANLHAKQFNIDVSLPLSNPCYAKLVKAVTETLRRVFILIFVEYLELTFYAIELF